jgi:hypothetical protein
LPKDLRVPFGEAITEKLLFKERFDQLSSPQQVFLKVIYGLPLDNKLKDRVGWTELEYYWASQGYADYDELGFITKVTIPEGLTYSPHAYTEAWGIDGIRAGKSEIAAFIVGYEAVCGGHEAYIRDGKKAVCFQIAQDLQFAQYALHGINANLESIPILARRTDKWKQVTARRIDLFNNMVIMTTPPTIKSVRGYDAPVTVMDEVGVWYQEADSANPDSAVYTQVKSRQAQFAHPKIVGISSPWNKAGLLWARYQAGTDGRNLLCDVCRERGLERPGCKACSSIRRPHRDRVVLHATTASLGNPLITRKWLQSTRDQDVKAFERECLARFLDSISGFLDSSLLQKAVEHGTIERPPQPRFLYVAAMDPAFRRDAFAFAIGHVDESGVFHIDLSRRWIKPQESMVGWNPTDILREIASLCARYKVSQVTTDQYHFESLEQLALQMGLSIKKLTFSAGSKAEIYGNLRNLLNTGKLRLLDDPETYSELASLERKLNQGGTVQISAPPNQHDDMATVVALCAHEASWMIPVGLPQALPTQIDDKKVHEAYEKGLHQACFDQAMKKRNEARFISDSE